MNEENRARGIWEHREGKGTVERGCTFRLEKHPKFSVSVQTQAGHTLKRKFKKTTSSSKGVIGT